MEKKTFDDCDAKKLSINDFRRTSGVIILLVKFLQRFSPCHLCLQKLNYHWLILIALLVVPMVVPFVVMQVVLNLIYLYKLER